MTRQTVPVFVHFSRALPPLNIHQKNLGAYCGFSLDVMGDCGSIDGNVPGERDSASSGRTNAQNVKISASNQTNIFILIDTGFLSSDYLFSRGETRGSR
ncbi:hypothetical protein Zmor_015144 [Zophobas morio]|uniref:Uncharacterized protein n=1 Tax=Zophobas morio TaxID=2755281 RepID=A0AA38IIX4_9CUCU|nr:hypothetical protein Zmor_015144 [Zophobas morio]